MATITSASTTAEITAAYLDNCGFSQDNSVAKAKEFETVCLAMLSRGIRTLDHAGEKLEFSPETLITLADRAAAYVANNASVADGGGGAVHPDLSGLRDY